MISQALNGASQMKRMADNGLFTAACHHIITNLSAPDKPIVTQKPDEQSTKNKLCIVTITSLLAVGTDSLI